MSKPRKITSPTAIESRRINRGIAADPDTFEVGAAEFRKLRPVRGRPLGSGRKVRITVRLDREIVEHFRAKGRGWQTRLNESLSKVVARERR